MTPIERDLIMGVAQRLKKAQLPQKDPEADSLINSEIAAQPNGVYVLTQAVILQEHALKQAQTQIESLQREAQAARDGQPAGGSFLGGLFGGSKSQPQRSVPDQPTTNDERPQPMDRQQGGGFGNFMRGAASVAVGVAGGHLLASALGDMFSGDPTVAADAPAAAENPETAAVDASDVSAEAEDTSFLGDSGGSGTGWGNPETTADTGGGWGGDNLADNSGGVEDDGGFGSDDFEAEDEDWG